MWEDVGLKTQTRCESEVKIGLLCSSCNVSRRKYVHYLNY